MLFNWVREETAINYTEYLGYIELLIAFMLITPELLPRFIQEIKKEKYYLYIFTSLSLMIFNFLIIFFSFSICLGIGFKFKFSNITDLVFLIILIFSVLIIELFKIIESIYYGLKKVKIICLLNFLISSIFIILLIFFQLLKFLNIYIIIFIYSISYLGSLIIILIIKFRNYEKVPRFKLNLKIAKNIIIFSYPLLLMNILYFLNFKVAILVLSLRNEIFSIYYLLATNFIILFIRLIGFPLNKITFTYFSEFFVKSEIKKIKNIYMFVFSIISFLEIFGLLLIYIFTPFIINILYINYANFQFITFFKMIVIGGFFYSLNQFLGSIIIARGKTKITLLAAFLGALTNIIFLIFYVIFRNFYFIGYGFIISTFIILIICSYFSKKYLELKIFKLKIIQVILCCVLSILSYEIIDYFFSVLYFSIFSSLITYFSMLFLLKVIKIENIKWFIHIITEALKQLKKDS